MKIAVRYYSRGGATEKVAKAIAREAGERAETTDRGLDKKVDLLFIGSGIYKGHIDSHVKDFVESLDASKVGKVVFFSTAMLGGGKSDEEIGKLLSEKEIPMDTRTFHCHGKFLFFHRGHPDKGSAGRGNLCTENHQEIKMKQRFGGAAFLMPC